MEIAKIVSQTLSTWPVICAIVTISFMVLFREPLSDFFRRIVKGGFYGVSLEAINPSEQPKEIKEKRALQSREDVEKYIREKPKEAIEAYFSVYTNYLFERGYNLIYGTQIELLEHLALRQDGATIAEVYPFYQKFLNWIRLAGLVPTKMDDYVGFLRAMGFVELVGVGSNLRAKITPVGINFLHYIRTQYPSYKYKVF